MLQTVHFVYTNHFLHRTLPVPPFHFFDVTDEVVGVYEVYGVMEHL
jgi:hypothetical protein